MIHLFQSDSIISSHCRTFQTLLNIKGPDQFPHKSVTFGSDSRRCLALSDLRCHGKNATEWGIFTALFDLLQELRLNIRKVCFQEGIGSYINLSDPCLKSNFWYNFQLNSLHSAFKEWQSLKNGMLQFTDNVIVRMI